MWQSIPLEEAARLIGSWWGTLPANPRSFLIPDSLVDCARNAGCEVLVEPILNWENSSDEQMWAEVINCSGVLQGGILLVTEASFQAGVGAFLFPADALDQVTTEHQSRYEPVFNGDVLIAVVEERRLLCVHHDSFLVTIRAPVERASANGSYQK